ncbi:MAG TPA: GNAT family N-acetyltransferase, partial [Bacillota bacterium]|nr:GNAT family N-acetyltransferase [Bacillota bacterium]
TRYIVIRKGRRVAAYIGFQLLGPAAHTISMCVHPEFRRRGLAALVQTTANEVAAALGARWFTGEVRVSNTPQLNFLKGLGWEQIGVSPHFFKNGEDAVVVWFWLN